MAATGEPDARRRAPDRRGPGLVRPPVGRLHLDRRRRLGLVRREPRRRDGPDAVPRPRRRRRAIRWSTARSSPATGRCATSTATRSPSRSPAAGRARRPARTTPRAGGSSIPGERLSIQLTPTVADQELDTRATTGVIYWEGSQVVRADAGRHAAGWRGVRGADGLRARRGSRPSLGRERPEIHGRQLHLGDRGERPRRLVERRKPREHLEHRLRVGAVGLGVEIESPRLRGPSRDRRVEGGAVAGQRLGARARPRCAARCRPRWPRRRRASAGPWRCRWPCRWPRAATARWRPRRCGRRGAPPAGGRTGGGRDRDGRGDRDRARSGGRARDRPRDPVGGVEGRCHGRVHEALDDDGGDHAADEQAHDRAEAHQGGRATDRDAHDQSRAAAGALGRAVVQRPRAGRAVEDVRVRLADRELRRTVWSLAGQPATQKIEGHPDECGRLGAPMHPTRWSRDPPGRSVAAEPRRRSRRR